MVAFPPACFYGVGGGGIVTAAAALSPLGRSRLSPTAGEAMKDEELGDEEIVRRVRAGEAALYELLMRRYNQRIYRVARSIVRDEEAEDVMQQAYVNAYT